MMVQEEYEMLTIDEQLRTVIQEINQYIFGLFIKVYRIKEKERC